MNALGRSALVLLVCLAASSLSRGAFAQEPTPDLSAPQPAVAPPAAAQATQPAPPSKPVHARFEGGPAVKSLYSIPFYGGQALAGIGGQFSGGKSRLYGTGQFFYATDATALRFAYGSLGVLFEREVASRLYVGISTDVSFASVSAKQNDYLATGLGGALHLGYDFAGQPGKYALFVQVSPSAAIFTGNNAGGPGSLGGALEVGYRQ